MNQDWDSDQYIKYEEERTRPSRDLISRIKINPNTILDIGCGPGNSTYQLKKAFPKSDLIGIDNSDNMLKKATETYPNIKFEKCDVPIGLKKMGGFDLVFSNACLHWIPNHKMLFSKIADVVNTGGILAVQIPLTQKAPFYKALDELKSMPKWEKINSVSPFHNSAPDVIYDILTEHYKNITMWETTYYHFLPNHESVTEWYKGSGLRAYLNVLETYEREKLINELNEMIKRDYPIQNDGKIILKMPRLFFTAEKA